MAKLKLIERKTTCQANVNGKKASIHVLISNKRDFRTETIKSN
jgi:hypothetical protein